MAAMVATTMVQTTHLDCLSSTSALLPAVHVKVVEALSADAANPAVARTTEPLLAQVASASHALA